eukprot:COSAG01_NODE_7992_length_2961_cov_69.700210_6_plen_96_part_01
MSGAFCRSNDVVSLTPPVRGTYPTPQWGPSVVAPLLPTVCGWSASQPASQSCMLRPVCVVHSDVVRALTPQKPATSVWVSSTSDHSPSPAPFRPLT